MSWSILFFIVYRPYMIALKISSTGILCRDVTIPIPIPQYRIGIVTSLILCDVFLASLVLEYSDRRERKVRLTRETMKLCKVENNSPSFGTATILRIDMIFDVMISSMCRKNQWVKSRLELCLYKNTIANIVHEQGTTLIFLLSNYR